MWKVNRLQWVANPFWPTFSYGSRKGEDSSADTAAGRLKNKKASFIDEAGIGRQKKKKKTLKRIQEKTKNTKLRTNLKSHREQKL